MKAMKVLAGVLLAAVTLRAYAAEPYQEYNKRIESAQTITALTDELMGDSVSLYNGATEFRATDISLPGNNELPVQLSRRFPITLLVGSSSGSSGNPSYRGAGNWDIEVPSISTTWAEGTWPNERCSSPTYPIPTAPLTPLDVWHGNSLHIPGEGDRKLLTLSVPSIPRPSDGAVWKWTTRERDMVRCIPMKSGLAGEGFLVQTVDGVKYYFDVATTRPGGSISIIWSVYYQVPITVGRTQYYLLASRIEDRFGNAVDYTYNSDGYPTKIASTDGRQITLGYANGRLASAAANGRSWTYGYGASGSDDGMLVEVAQPDGSQWGYSHTGSLYEFAALWDGGSNANCTGGGPVVPASFGITVTHPAGSRGVFTFGNFRHARMGVHANACSESVSDGQYSYHLLIPTFSDVMSLGSKTISGPGLADRNWTYHYPFSGKGPLWGTRGGNAPPYPCTTCVSEKTVTVD